MDLVEALAKIAKLEEELAYEKEQSSKLIKQKVDKVQAGYSADRLSLALEIKETLEFRGHWTPKENWAGPDLITAVGKALDKGTKKKCKDQDTFHMLKGRVRGYWIIDMPLTKEACLDVMTLCENVTTSTSSDDAKEWLSEARNYLVDDGDDDKFMWSWTDPDRYNCQVITYTDFIAKYGKDRPALSSGTAEPKYLVKD